MTRSRKSLTAKRFWHPEQPFLDLPLLPPEADLESRAVLKSCIEARAAVAELKQAAELIPNQAVLINTLPLLEAQASSEIENIVTTTDKLFQFRDDDARADTATREALRYGRALFEGFQSLKHRPLSARTAEEICSLIKGQTMPIRQLPGTALASEQSGKVVYTPPVGVELLWSLLANWERFLHEAKDLDPLIRMAVAHYQFEAIHPFTDGNGRTGRVLNSLYFISEGLLTLPILYLSRFIIRNKAEYYRLLLAVTQDGVWEDWLLFMLDGVRETAKWTVDKISAVRSLQSVTTEYVRDNAPRIYSHELVNVIFEQPYCRIQNVCDRRIAGRQTAATYLKTLVKIGVLLERSMGREKLFVHPRLMTLLTRDTNEWPSFPSAAPETRSVSKASKPASSRKKVSR